MARNAARHEAGGARASRGALGRARLPQKQGVAGRVAPPGHGAFAWFGGQTQLAPLRARAYSQAAYWPTGGAQRVRAARPGPGALLVACAPSVHASLH